MERNQIIPSGQIVFGEDRVLEKDREVFRKADGRAIFIDKSSRSRTAPPAAKVLSCARVERGCSAKGVFQHPKAWSSSATEQSSNMPLVSGLAFSTGTRLSWSPALSRRVGRSQARPWHGKVNRNIA